MYKKENGRGGIQEEISKWAAMQGHIFIYWKIHADEYGNAGKWDGLLIFNDGHHLWAETKTDTGSLSALQKQWGIELWSRGCDMKVVRSLQEFKEVVEYYLKYRDRGKMPVELEERVRVKLVAPKKLR